MGLVEQSCFLLRRDPASLLDADDPPEALRAHVLAIEAVRLQLEQALLLLRQEEAELSRRCELNGRRIALAEREIRRALAVESDEAAREAIHGKRELVEIERELAIQRAALAHRASAIEADARALADQSARARALRSSPAGRPAARLAEAPARIAPTGRLEEAASTT